ncbi:DUF4184 family protein [Pimelobacter simplex]|uniref:DUF4184 family protein n=1 Tax=Nocardioides simplex TaxID=2045 RepID=UPI003AB02D54
MPLTLAHPAVVLPLRGLGLPLAGLVIGSMAPDLPVFARWHEGYALSHSLAGILTLDVVVTLALLALWDLVGRDALVDTAPSPVRDRLPERARIGRRAWLLAPLAAVVGSTTHVVWDLFTHSGRWGVRHVAWLHEVHGPLRGDAWAQYGSTAIGLLVVGAAMLLHLRRLPPGPRRPRRLPAAALPAAVVLAGVAGVVGGLEHTEHGLDIVAFWTAVSGIVALAAGLALITVAWLVAPAPAPADEVSDPVAP